MGFQRIAFICIVLGVLAASIGVCAAEATYDKYYETEKYSKHDNGKYDKHDYGKYGYGKYGYSKHDYGKYEKDDDFMDKFSKFGRIKYSPNPTAESYKSYELVRECKGKCAEYDTCEEYKGYEVCIYPDGEKKDHEKKEYGHNGYEEKEYDHNGYEKKDYGHKDYEKKDYGHEDYEKKDYEKDSGHTGYEKKDVYRAYKKEDDCETQVVYVCVKEGKKPYCIKCKEHDGKKKKEEEKKVY